VRLTPSQTSQAMYETTMIQSMGCTGAKSHYVALQGRSPSARGGGRSLGSRGGRAAAGIRAVRGCERRSLDQCLLVAVLTVLVRVDPWRTLAVLVRVRPWRIPLRGTCADLRAMEPTVARSASFYAPAMRVSGTCQARWRSIRRAHSADDAPTCRQGPRQSRWLPVDRDGARPRVRRPRARAPCR